MSCVYRDGELGAVSVTVRKDARRFTARWKGGRVYVTVPCRTTVADYESAMAVLKPRLLAHRPTPDCRYHDGLVIEVPGLRLRFVKAERQAGDVRMLSDGDGYVISLSPSLEFSDPDVVARVDYAVGKVAEHVAPRLLLPRARELAERFGLGVRGWKIGRGRRTLGTCSASSVITISCACVFLTEELRDYIICHELAHLTEMNHSPRFHALCDRYCGGRERELSSALKHYRWPAMR